MNQKLPILIVTTALSVASLAPSAHAAVIDAVQDKVNAIKNDTSTIKTNANSQLRETVDIRDALDPLFTMRDRLTAMGIDPAEFLDMIPADEIRGAIDEVRARQQEVQDAMNDPNLEAYRYELLDLIAGINLLVAENGVVQVSPLQTLIENAPIQQIAILKIAMDQYCSELMDLVA